MYGYTGEPDLQAYIIANAASAVSVEHLVKPGREPGENPYHYLVVHIDGDKIRIEVIGVDWGRDFQPYRSKWSGLEDILPLQ